MVEMEVRVWVVSALHRQGSFPSLIPVVAAAEHRPPPLSSAKNRGVSLQKKSLCTKQKVENPGIDPGASRMRSGRSTNELIPRVE